mgnify:CR=1 FL=1
MTEMKLIPAEERKALLANCPDDIHPASARMASRAIERWVCADPATELPHVMRRLLALEAEVEQLRTQLGEARMDLVYAAWPGEPGL